MREIKFRAFDTKNKIMHHDFQFIRTGDAGNDWVLIVSDKHSIKDYEWTKNPYFAQQFNIMQCTCIKDKNGNDIYEGDILRFFKSLSIVEWETIGWTIKPINYTNKILYKFNTSSFKAGRAFEIVGNICENPELTKLED